MDQALLDLEQTDGLLIQTDGDIQGKEKWASEPEIWCNPSKPIESG